MAAIQPGGTVRVARARGNRVSMDQATRRPAQLEARRLASHGMAAPRLQILRRLHGECGFCRWPARTNWGRDRRAHRVHLLRRTVVAMPPAYHFGQSAGARLGRRAHHADREAVAARARAFRARCRRTNNLRRYCCGGIVNYAAARWLSACRRNPAVYEAFTPATSSGVPFATTWPPRSPPSGPRSIR
jgi:hypothetical protein